MEIYIGVCYIIGAAVFVGALIVGIINLFMDELDIVAACATVMLAALVAPLILPLLVLSVPVVGVMHMLIDTEKIKQPKWWRWTSW